MQRVRNALEFGPSPPTEEIRRVARLLLSKSGPAQQLVQRMQMALGGSRRGAPSSYVWRVLCSARLDVGEVLFNAYFMVTPVVHHVVFMMLRSMYISAKRVMLPHSPVEVRATTFKGMLLELEALGDELRPFSRAVNQVCKGPEGDPDLYRCAFQTLIRTTGFALMDVRVLATPRLGDFVLWCLADVVVKIRPFALDYAERARGQRRSAAAEREVADAAQLLLGLSRYRPGAQ